MVLINIFESPEGEATGLWSVKYDGDLKNIFETTLENWQDVEWIQNFCEEHYEDIQNTFGPMVSPDEAAIALMDEADFLEKALVDASCRPNLAGNLQTLFKPLFNSDVSITVLQPSKVSAKDKRKFKNPRLRIYAIRICPNTYIVTGGAIKLTDRMEQRLHTRNELEKIKKVKDWLKATGIGFPEDLKTLS